MNCLINEKIYFCLINEKINFCVGNAWNPECRCTLTTSRNNPILITLSTSRNNSTSVHFPSISTTMTKRNSSNLTFLHNLWRMHGGNGVKFVCWCVLAWSIQKYVVHSLLIFLLLEQFWHGSKWVEFWASGHFKCNAWKDWPDIWHADAPW